MQGLGIRFRVQSALTGHLAPCLWPDHRRADTLLALGLGFFCVYGAADLRALIFRIGFCLGYNTIFTIS